MDKIIRNILDELNAARNAYSQASSNEDDVTFYYYGKYWAIREAIQIIEKHINNGEV